MLLPDRGPGRTLDLVTLGEPLVALVGEPGLPLGAAGRFRRAVVGAEANVAVGLARLGHEVGYAGRVGADALGDAVRRALRAEGIRFALGADPDRPSGVLVRSSGPAAVEVVHGRTGSAGSGLAPGDLPWEAWGGARVAHVTGITAVLSASAGEAVVDLVERAHAAGAAVVLDPNVRPRLAPPATFAAALAPVLPRVSLVVAGEDELEVLTGRSGDDAVKALHGEGVALVVGTRGAAGAWADDGRERVEVPARPVAVVDPVGAGDAFTAGLLSALLDGLGVPAALDRGAAVAARVVAAWGDQEGLPTRRELSMTGDVAR